MNGVKEGDKRMANGRMKINDIGWKFKSESIYQNLTNIT